MPLDAALQVVTAEVRLSRTGDHWTAARCISAQERLSTTLGPDFGSLAVRYTVSQPHWRLKQDDLLPWEGTQEWFLSRDRLVGLVTLEATADQSRAGVYGRIRLGLKRQIERLGDAWRYGRLNVRIHGHNYARIDARPSETSMQDPADLRSTEITLIDPRSAAAGEQGDVAFKKGDRFWFLVEVYRDDPTVAPAERVERIDGPLCGFRFRERGREIAVLHNPTDRAVELAGPRADPWGVAGPRTDQWDRRLAGPQDAMPSENSIYRDNTGTPGVLKPGEKLRIEPSRHVVVVSAVLASINPTPGCEAD
jgi:hypothetical protein